MLFDTHTHIQFKVFDKIRDKVINDAKKADVKKIIVVGTDVESSKKAVEVAEKYPEVYASIGIHPHHAFQYCHSERSEESLSLSEKGSETSSEILRFAQDDINKLEEMLSNPNIVAVGETGLDEYIYKKTKYSDYKISEKFVELQKEIFVAQIKLAIKYKKSLIVHNIGTAKELIKILEENWDDSLKGKTVFHCCEPDQKLLDFAIKNNIYIGIDGDITYYPAKQEFIKKIPLELLVLETDSPFIIPDPLYTQGAKINKPENINLILGFVSKLLKIKKEKLEEIIYKNSEKLFQMKLA